ncbi:DUF2510 domain-containing protein [Rhodococcus sp. BGS-1C]|uniref:DUF2510 domain-containing protein n=1 Tax=unclassified Rhodococcus (in: high G+C Gram-positive bacteria) TaxID=192944 RepID=UPI0019D1268C|nr:DUF2510 domain-containing protein [Rhodococcus sp. KRD197]
MEAIQIVVIALVAVASCAIVAGFVAMLVSSERRDLGRDDEYGIAPGWYPDAQDKTLLRYFDGRIPTRETARRELT